MKSFIEALTDLGDTMPLRGGSRDDMPQYWLVHANGDADFHDNIILFGFGEKMGEPVLVAKVPRLVENGGLLQVEYDRLSELYHRLGEDAALHVPEPYAFTSVQGRPVLILSYIGGQSLTRLSTRSFWGDERKVAGLAVEAARSLRRLHERSSASLEEGEPLTSEFERTAEAFRNMFDLTEKEQNGLRALVLDVREARRGAGRKVIIQGDFWHGNMIRATGGAGLRFVDWQFARWSADVSLDVYFFLLAGAFSASAASGAVEARAVDAARILGSWRGSVIPEYLAAYGGPAEYALLPLRSGMLLACVEKAVRPAVDFGYRHPDDLIWRHLYAELLNWPELGGRND